MNFKTLDLRSGPGIALATASFIKMNCAGSRIHRIKFSNERSELRQVENPFAFEIALPFNTLDDLRDAPARFPRSTPAFVASDAELYKFPGGRKCFRLSST
jgi:hypothetical protein